MSKYCVCCGSVLPKSHPYRVCSMCYGDPYFGTDGYMLRAMEEEAQREAMALEELIRELSNEEEET